PERHPRDRDLSIRRRRSPRAAPGRARPRLARDADCARRVDHLVASRRPADDHPSRGRRGAPRHVPRRDATDGARGGRACRHARPPPRGARMTPAATTPLVAQRMQVRQRLTDYLALTKPRVVLMVLITTFVGYYLGSRTGLDALPLLHTLTGTALAAGGTMALNQFIERQRDSQMVRTRHRPLP